MEKALRGFARIVADVSDRSATMPRMAMAAHQIRVLPTLVFFDEKGNETDRFEGNQSADVLIAAAIKARGGPQ
ncbi:MAG: hypothetical protein INH34_06900 [Phycisphaerales bacterium]|nr:hypothetical protein [Phycisphaerales bacterium]